MNRVKVAVSGAAGQIGYSFLFRLSREVFGKNDKIDLQLLEIPNALKAAEGVALELYDCAFSNINSIEITDDPNKAFDGANWAFLIGSKPRGPGMERADLIRDNGPIFVQQGRALMKAADDIRVIVVGNPCNTNTLIAQHHAVGIPKKRFFAMTQLDENRAKAQLALKAKTSVESVTNMAIWGNHSPTMFPDYEHAQIDKKPVEEIIQNQKWFKEEFLHTVQKRGAQIIAARGQSSAASAASALIDMINNLIHPSVSQDYFSAAVSSDDNSYRVPNGLFFSFPIRSKDDGDWEIVEGIPLSDFAKEKIGLTTEELAKEREIIQDLLS